MKPTVLIIAAAVAAILTATASGSRDRQQDSTALARITALRGETVKCERSASLPVSKVGKSPLRHAGGAYRSWVAHRWSSRLAMCRTILDHTLQHTSDWYTAVQTVQRAYPGSSWWLMSCSSGEGGHGGFVMNYGGSGAGGWMQYMEGTFWHDFDSGVADLRARGFREPPESHSWYDPLGQAIAAGWAYGHDRPSGKWTGYGC